MLSGAERIVPEVVSVACVVGGRSAGGFGRIWGFTGMMNVNDDDDDVVAARASPAKRANDRVKRTRAIIGVRKELFLPGQGTFRS